jgi:hypothetical protein
MLNTIAAVAVALALVGSPLAPQGCPPNWVAKPDPTWPYQIGCYPPGPPPGYNPPPAPIFGQHPNPPLPMPAE